MNSTTRTSVENILTTSCWKNDSTWRVSMQSDENEKDKFSSLLEATDRITYLLFFIHRSFKS